MWEKQLSIVKNGSTKEKRKLIHFKIYNSLNMNKHDSYIVYGIIKKMNVINNKKVVEEIGHKRYTVNYSAKDKIFLIKDIKYVNF